MSSTGWDFRIAAPATKRCEICDTRSRSPDASTPGGTLISSVPASPSSMGDQYSFDGAMALTGIGLKVCFGRFDPAKRNVTPGPGPDTSSPRRTAAAPGDRTSTRAALPPPETACQGRAARSIRCCKSGTGRAKPTSMRRLLFALVLRLVGARPVAFKSDAVRPGAANAMIWRGAVSGVTRGLADHGIEVGPPA